VLELAEKFQSLLARRIALLYLGRYVQSRTGMVWCFACTYGDVNLARASIAHLPEAEDTHVTIELLFSHDNHDPDDIDVPFGP
jgi:hypothetical protein